MTSVGEGKAENVTRVVLGGRNGNMFALPFGSKWGGGSVCQI